MGGWKLAAILRSYTPPPHTTCNCQILYLGGGGDSKIPVAKVICVRGSNGL